MGKRNVIVAEVVRKKRIARVAVVVELMSVKKIVLVNERKNAKENEKEKEKRKRKEKRNVKERGSVKKEDGIEKTKKEKIEREGEGGKKRAHPAADLDLAIRALMTMMKSMRRKD